MFSCERPSECPTCTQIVKCACGKIGERRRIAYHLAMMRWWWAPMAKCSTMNTDAGEWRDLYRCTQHYLVAQSPPRAK